MTTTSNFKYIDTSTYSGKPWIKVDCPDRAFAVRDYPRTVINIRGRESKFTTDNCGFQIIRSPSKEKYFDEATVSSSYYQEIESLIRKRMSVELGQRVKKIHIFDHTTRRRGKDFARQPVEQVHADQTAQATIDHIRRYLPAEEVDSLLQRRYQIINVWRPIEHPASDFPLAVIDWRSTEVKDFVSVDVMFPQRSTEDYSDDNNEDEDKNSAVKLPDPATYGSIEQYEQRDEAMAVKFNDRHQFYYLKDMMPEEVMLLKCYDSFGEGQPHAVKGVAVWAPHTAFRDPQTPVGAPDRQSIEVRCLVFYE